MQPLRHTSAFDLPLLRELWVVIANFTTSTRDYARLAQTSAHLYDILGGTYRVVGHAIKLNDRSALKAAVNVVMPLDQLLDGFSSLFADYCVFAFAPELPLLESLGCDMEYWIAGGFSRATIIKALRNYGRAVCPQLSDHFTDIDWFLGTNDASDTVMDKICDVFSSPDSFISPFLIKDPPVVIIHDITLSKWSEQKPMQLIRMHTGMQKAIKASECSAGFIRTFDFSSSQIAFGPGWWKGKNMYATPAFVYSLFSGIIIATPKFQVMPWPNLDPVRSVIEGRDKDGFPIWSCPVSYKIRVLLGLKKLMQLGYMEHEVTQDIFNEWMAAKHEKCDTPEKSYLEILIERDLRFNFARYHSWLFGHNV